MAVLLTVFEVSNELHEVHGERFRRSHCKKKRGVSRGDGRRKPLQLTELLREIIVPSRDLDDKVDRPEVE